MQECLLYLGRLCKPMKNLDGQKLQLCTDKRVMEARNVHSLNSLNEYIKLLSM